MKRTGTYAACFNYRRFIAAAFLLSASTVLAQFEGILEMKTTIAGRESGGPAGGVSTCAISKEGTRIGVSAMGVNMVMLMKTGTPDVMYRINEADKTYTVVNLAQMRGMAARNAGEEKAAGRSAYSVKKLGEEKILGHNTQHVLVSGATTMEMWIARDLGNFGEYGRMQTSQGGGGEDLLKALKDAGCDGVPLKTVTDAGGGGQVIMQVTKVEARMLPASTFEIPADFKEVKGGMMGLGGSADRNKTMEDAMKNMSPEQRQKMREMIRKQSGAN